jgi:hypothetical protein
MRNRCTKFEICRTKVFCSNICTNSTIGLRLHGCNFYVMHFILETSLIAWILVEPFGGEMCLGWYLFSEESFHSRFLMVDTQYFGNIIRSTRFFLKISLDLSPFLRLKMSVSKVSFQLDVWPITSFYLNHWSTWGGEDTPNKCSSYYSSSWLSWSMGICLGFR